MKILHIPRRFVREKWGGTETVIQELSLAARTNSHEVEILCPAIFSTPGTEQGGEGIIIRRFAYFYPYIGLKKSTVSLFDNRGGNLFSFSFLKYLLFCPKPDIIHLHTGKRLGAIVRTVARFRKIPYFISVHGGLYDVPEEEKVSHVKPAAGCWEWGKILGFLFGSHRVFADAAGIFCLNKREAGFLRREYPENKVYLLPNGVNSKRFAPSSENRSAFRAKHGFNDDSLIILNVARIDPQKNQLCLLKLLKNLRQDGIDAFLLLAGAVTDEVYAGRLKSEVTENGLDAFVHYMGSLAPDSELLPVLYQAADLFLLPSRHEPFGIVILEAWAASLPVVAAAVGGIPDLIDDGETGLLFEPDNEEQMFTHIIKLIRDKSLREKIRLLSRQKAVADYDWQKISDKLEEIYKGEGCANNLCE